MTGGKSSTRGTPQGGVASPLLANLYMNRFLKHWRLTGRGEAFRAHVVSYADDFVILSRGHAAEALAWTKAVMTKLGLTLNEAKTSVKDARHGTLRLPWLHVRAAPLPEGRPLVPGREPVQEERAADQDKVGELLVPGNKGPWPEVRDQLNSFCAAGRATSATERGCRPIGRSTTTSMTAFATSCAGGTRCQGRGTRRFSRTIRSSENSACCVSDACILAAAVCLAMKPVGKPDAGNPHVRFDERGEETERCRTAQATAPFLDSTRSSGLRLMASR